MYDYLDLAQAETFVQKENARGRTMFWDGWEIVSWKPNNVGFMRSDGAFMYGRWGIKRVIRPNKYGKYRINASVR